MFSFLQAAVRGFPSIEPSWIAFSLLSFLSKTSLLNFWGWMQLSYRHVVLRWKPFYTNPGMNVGCTPGVHVSPWTSTYALVIWSECLMGDPLLSHSGPIQLGGDSGVDVDLAWGITYFIWPGNTLGSPVEERCPEYLAWPIATANRPEIREGKWMDGQTLDAFLQYNRLILGSDSRGVQMRA